ncbi:MAG TPA: hypothetical protein VJT49_15555 [Amycolatopsis sp.]|nr:hypothetical protein [Amycolatopsis sp.]HKS46494.1 hypothetical protein [Amycolatopsis sp.]
MLVQALTFPVRVTVHLMFALANHWQATSETCELATWPDDDEAADR